MKGQYSHIKLQFFSLDEGGYHIVMKGLVNGKTACFIVDTGSSRTVFDRNTIEDYLDSPKIQSKKGKAVTLSKKSIDVDSVTIGRLAFGKTIVRDYPCVVMDLSGVQKAYESFNLPSVQGIIGGDLLKSLKAVINYETCKIRLERQQG